MQKSKAIGLVVILILIVGAIFYLSRPSDASDLSNSSNDDSVNSDSSKVLSENGDSKYIEFSQTEYEKALSENKIVLLYFYASWCPICKAEQPAVIGAFNELGNEMVIGFRVNYKDPSTDVYEESLAEEFGIPYQHTKVIIKNGEQVLKALDSWNKERYLEELNNLI